MNIYRKLRLQRDEQYAETTRLSSRIYNESLSIEERENARVLFREKDAVYHQTWDKLRKLIARPPEVYVSWFEYHEILPLIDWAPDRILVWAEAGTPELAWDTTGDSHYLLWENREQEWEFVDLQSGDLLKWERYHWQRELEEGSGNTPTIEKRLAEIETELSTYV